MAIFSTGRGDRDGSSGQPLSTAAGGKRGVFSLIGPDVVITGNIAASADLHIGGRVAGDVRCANLVQESDSHIEGAIDADTARIAGSITGSVSVRTLTIERAARIVGDLAYESITIEPGAVINGRLQHIGGDADVTALDRTVQLETELDIVHFTTSGQAA
uniref:bactofilin family protein n=1 Tax=uncultured Sphingomonas sp. TaxID=158754 RepID=UPI0035CBA451